MALGDVFDHVKFPRRVGINITEKLKTEMSREKFQQLLDFVGVADKGVVSSIDSQKILDELVKDMLMVKPMVGPAQGTTATAPRNYEAAIHSRLAVFGNPPVFDLIKVHRTRDQSRFYVFIVTNDKWVVLEDDELFPSDKLISAMRCLAL